MRTACVADLLDVLGDLGTGARPVVASIVADIGHNPSIDGIEVASLRDGA